VTPVSNTLFGANPTDIVLSATADPWKVTFNPALGELIIPPKAYAMISVFMSPAVPTSITTNYYGGTVTEYSNTQTWGGPTTNLTVVCYNTDTIDARVAMATSSGSDASWTVFAATVVTPS